MDADSGMEVSHIVFESRIDHLIVFTYPASENLFQASWVIPCRARGLDSVGVSLISGYGHSSFSGGDILGDIKAEGPQIPEGPTFCHDIRFLWRGRSLL